MASTAAPAAVQCRAVGSSQGADKKKRKKPEVVWSDEDKAKLAAFEEGNVEDWKKVAYCQISNSPRPLSPHWLIHTMLPMPPSWHNHPLGLTPPVVRCIHESFPAHSHAGGRSLEALTSQQTVSIDPDTAQRGGQGPGPRGDRPPRRGDGCIPADEAAARGQPDNDCEGSGLFL